VRILRAFVFIDNGACLGKANKFHDTALTAAAHSGSLDVVKYLIEVHGMSPDEQKHAQGYTALMRASKQGKLNIVRYLCENHRVSALLPCGRGEKMNAMELAAKEGHAEIARYLMRKERKVILRLMTSKLSRLKMLYPVILSALGLDVEGNKATMYACAEPSLGRKTCIAK